MRPPSPVCCTSILIFCAKDSASSCELACARIVAKNLNVAAGLAVKLDATELVFDAHRLSCAERHRLLKIPRHLLLCGICGRHGLYGEEKHRGEQARNRCRTQLTSAEIGAGAIPCCLD